MQIKQGTFLIADISGYTEFIANSNLIHAKEIITQILDRLNGICSEKLILNKIEGDALFYYSLELDKKDLIKEALEMHDRFHEVLKDIKKNHNCIFKKCGGYEKMHIKFIIHEGYFAIHTIGKFKELIGKPIIELHRLLKNSVLKNSYIIVIDKKGKFSEEYKHLGIIRYNLIGFHS